MLKKIGRTVVSVAPVATGLSLIAGSAFAVGPDLTELTGAVDLSTVLAAIMLIGGLKFAPQIGKYAVITLQRMFPK